MADLKVDLLLKALKEMGYDALVLGKVDLAVGVPYLLGKKRGNRPPFLLSNLAHAQNPKTVFTPYMVKNLKATRVWVFSLVAEEYLRNGLAEENGNFRILPPEETARKMIAELKKKQCRVIVAVTPMPLEGIKSLAQGNPEIDFIINGHSQEPKADAIPVHKTQLLTARSQKEFLGRLDLRLKGKAPVLPAMKSSIRPGKRPPPPRLFIPLSH